MRFIATFFAILSLARAAPAAQLRQPVMSGSKYTYADLLRKVFPNLRVDKTEPEKASASKSVVIRHITGDEKPFEIDSDVKIEDVRRVDLHIAGKAQEVLMFIAKVDEGKNGASEIALFDLSGSPKLLDID